jgi:hypothetical protein
MCLIMCGDWTMMDMTRWKGVQSKWAALVGMPGLVYAEGIAVAGH